MSVLRSMVLNPGTRENQQINKRPLFALVYFGSAIPVGFLPLISPFDRWNPILALPCDPGSWSADSDCGYR